MNLTFAAIALVTLQAQMQAPAPPAPDKVVITVNGHTILAKEVEGYLWEWNAAQVGQALTAFALISQEATKQGIVLKDADVRSKVNMEVQRILASAPKGSATTDEALKARGVARSRIEFGVRAQMLMEALAGKDFKAEDFVRVSTLIVRPKTESAVDVQDSLSKANNAYTALEKGDLWDKVLSSYGTDPQAARNHGDLGWLKLDQFPPTSRAELVSLKVNGYTKPVQTPNGLQIFRLEARGKDATPQDLSEVKARLLATQERDIMDRLQKQAKITTAY